MTTKATRAILRELDFHGPDVLGRYIGMDCQIGLVMFSPLIPSDPESLMNTPLRDEMIKELDAICEEFDSPIWQDKAEVAKCVGKMRKLRRKQEMGFTSAKTLALDIFYKYTLTTIRARRLKK